jgi:hypothetical protein
MSRRRPAQSQRRPDRRKPPPSARPLKASPPAVSIKSIVIPAILAAIAGAVFIFQILEPTSFLSAIRGVEFNAIPRATWEEMYSEFRSRMAADLVALKHDAADKLISAMAIVEPGPLPAELKNESTHLIRSDFDNLLSRLTYATLPDFEAAAAKSCYDRFNNFRRMMESPPQAQGAHLYNEEYTRAWFEVLKTHFRRADVAASAAVTLNHYQIVDHFAALPKLQRRLSEFSAQLRAEGYAEYADACIQWLGQALLGLIDSEKDAGTRLLCAELLEKIAGPNRQVATDLASLREAYQAGASAAPIDPTHPSRPPVVGTEEFRRVWTPFIAAVVVFLTSIGALVVLGVAVLALAARAIAGKNEEPALARGPPMLRSAGIGAACAALMAAICVRAMSHGPYSMAWAALLSLAIIAWGVLTVALTMTSGASSGEMPRKRRLGVIALTMVALWILAASPPGPIAYFLRRIDLATGGFSLVLAALGVVVLSSTLLVFKNGRLLARSAAVVWMATAITALAILQFHRVQDNRWMQHAAQARLDEFPTRLGPDWQDKYLKSARAAYDIPRP